MPVHSVVLVNESSMPITPETLTEVARALQTQVIRDFIPLWRDIKPVPVSASLSTAPIPTDASPIRIVDDNATSLPLGVHLSAAGRPQALVRARPDWTITASHELLEMLGDPEGNTFRPGLEIGREDPRRRVRYLLEVCDPCQIFDYTIGNIAVSDFVSPAYFGPEAADGMKVDFLGRLSGPRDVPAGCTLSWRSGRRWYQKQPSGKIVTFAATSAGSARDDRDTAFTAALAELRHDLLAARRTLFREMTQTMVDELFSHDPVMQVIVNRTARKYRWSVKQRREAVNEYKRYLMLVYLNPGIQVAALSLPADLLWHQHIIDTKKYRNDCYRIFGHSLDHTPFYDTTRAAQPGIRKAVRDATTLYKEAFGEAPISALGQYCIH